MEVGSLELLDPGLGLSKEMVAAYSPSQAVHRRARVQAGCTQLAWVEAVHSLVVAAHRSVEGRSLWQLDQGGASW